MWHKYSLFSRIKNEILISYDQYKHAASGKPGSATLPEAYYYVDQPDYYVQLDEEMLPTQLKELVKPEQPTGFWTKIKGSFFMFSGYLGNPTVTVVKGNLITEELPNNKADDNPNYFWNHFGLYDVFTLSIPYFLEYLFRGNWLGSRLAQNRCQALFTIIPIVPVLATIRNGFGFIATLLFSPIVAGVHAVDNYLFKMAEQKFARESAELQDDQEITGFNNQYIKLKELFKNNQGQLSPEELVKQAKILLNGTEIKIKNQDDSEESIEITGLNAQAKTIPDAVKENEGLFFRSPTKMGKRLKKIQPNGKYSVEAFEKTFNSGKKLN